MFEGNLKTINARCLAIVQMMLVAIVLAIVLPAAMAWADDDVQAEFEGFQAKTAVLDGEGQMENADKAAADNQLVICDENENEEAGEAGEELGVENAAAYAEVDGDAGCSAELAETEKLVLASSGDGAQIETQASDAIADGVYTIKSSSTYGQALGNKSSYANNAAVQSYNIDGGYDQLFYFQLIRDDLFSIFSVHSGLALTASSGKVVQSTYSGSDSQLFAVRSTGCYYALISSVGAVTALGGSEAKIQGYDGSTTQKFRLTEAPLVLPGVQVLRSAADTGKAVRAKDGTSSVGTAAQAADYSSNGSYNLVVQRKGSNYAVRTMTSGGYLAPSGSSVNQVSSATVWNAQFSTNGARRGVMLTNGSVAAQVSGSSIAAAEIIPSVAQSFLPMKTVLVSNGYYNVRASNGKVADVANGSFSNGANIQVINGNGSGAQVFYFEDIGGGVFLIRSSKSYKVLEAKGGGTGDGTNVWQYAQNNTPAQLWVPVADAGGQMTFINVKSGKALTFSGTNACINASKGSADQHWTLVATKQYSLTGNSQLDRILANVLGTHTTLKSAFDYVAYNFSYRSGNKHWSGWSLSDSTSQSYAIEMYNYGSGNCYRFASLFAWLARGLGYTNVVVRTGWVVGYSAPQAPHGWATVNGYVCDPDMQHEASSRNWYWQTYASAPTAYYSW